ncbi:hypothetical protein NMG60_11014418 [Bertholletia excelsa]
MHLLPIALLNCRVFGQPSLWSSTSCNCKKFTSNAYISGFLCPNSPLNQLPCLPFCLIRIGIHRFPCLIFQIWIHFWNFVVPVPWVVRKNQ